jgi:hypothetical protein
MNGLFTYFGPKGDVDLGDATGGHCRRSVKSTKLLNKRFRKGLVGFEVTELIGVLQKSDDSLGMMRQGCIRDSAYLVCLWRAGDLRD